MKENEVIHTTENDTVAVQKEFMNNKNSTTSVILLVIILIGVLVFVFFKSKPLTMKEIFDNTIEVNNITYEYHYYAYDNDEKMELPNGENLNKILIDFNKSIFKDNDEYIYYNENKKLVKGNNDKMLEYYFASINYDSYTDYVSLINRIFDGIESYNYKSKDNVYTHTMDGKESFDYKKILVDIDDKFEDAKTTKVEIKVNTDHVDDMKLYYKLDDKESYVYIKFTMINETDINLSSETEKKAYESYYDFVSINEKKTNKVHDYVLKNDECSNNVKSVTIHFNKYLENLNNMKITAYDCSNSLDEKYIYVKNVSGNTGVDHIDDVYEIRSSSTGDLIAKFTYDKKHDTIKVFDNKELSGTYKRVS